MSDHGKNGSSSHSSKRRETEGERAIRKEKERLARENETEGERKIRKEKERKREEEKLASRSSHDKKKETEEERRIRKEKEASGRRRETEEERTIRKEKERKERENETEEERKIRKDKERKREEERRASKKETEKRKETEQERQNRKEKEQKLGEKETEDERRKRKEREKESSRSRKETEEERRERKEKISGDKMKCKTEPMELNEDFFLKEEARLSMHADKPKKEALNQNEESFKEEEPMEESEDDVPLRHRKKPKVEDSGEESDVPLAKRKKIVKKLKRKPAGKAKPSKRTKTEDEDDYEPESESKKGKPKNVKVQEEAEETKPAKKLTKKEKELEEEKNVWKWWEEKDKKDKENPDKKDDGIKWKFLEHKGPLLAPVYEPLPSSVRFWYDGKIMRLSEATEEVCTFYAKMLDHDYTTKDVFNKNFMKDWRKTMKESEKEKITDLTKCDFTEIHEHFKKISEERKARSKEEKNKEKEKNAQIQAEYGMCTLDGHEEKIGNFRVEPPGLFRGRGEHPKQGMVKTRVKAKDIIINCSKDSKVPKPPPGQKWKEVKHDNKVTWLASWTENIQGAIKYVMLNPSSKLKAEKDWDKYEKARNLKNHIENIRKDYQSDYKEKEMKLRQRAVALYFIDKLALRAGNEKDEDQADTVGCCSLRCEHIELYEEKDGDEWVVEFDFLGKDSIRYYNVVSVEKRVWKNLKLFKKDKGPNDELFDRLSTTTLNEYLKDLMPGLSAKVFRTYNASITLQEQLDKLTNPDDNVAAKMLSYNRANREVAVLCNHQRAVPKTHDKSMANLMEKIEKKEETIKEAEKLLKAAKKAYKNGEDRNKESVEKRKKAVEKLKEQLEKLEIQRTDKDENKTIALGTSKLNYLDPRISVAWCKKHDVPIEKVYNKTQRQKFMWAINMAEADFVF